MNLADYKKSVGFDQLVLIESALNADIALKFYNNDGTEASACGNGSRCAAKLIEKTHLTIATKGRILTANLQQNGMVSINMGKADILEENLEFLEFKGSFVEIGNPHIIIIVEDLAQVDLAKSGPIIENDQRFPNKVNVNFVQIIDEQNVKAKTWERGAGATLSCGTGACASFALLHKNGLIADQAIISQPGGDLYLSINDSQEICLAGNAQISYKGRVEITILN